ncbi:hypothetical protein [Streptomyces chartreusis]
MDDPGVRRAFSVDSKKPWNEGAWEKGEPEAACSRGGVALG